MTKDKYVNFTYEIIKKRYYKNLRIYPSPSSAKIIFACGYNFFPFLSGSGFFCFTEIFKTNAKKDQFSGLSMKGKKSFA